MDAVITTYNTTIPYKTVIVNKTYINIIVIGTGLMSESSYPRVKQT